MPANPANSARFHAEEERAIASLADWIGHPAIPAVIREAAVPAAAAVMLLARHLRDQVEIIWFSWNVFEIAPVRPGWQKDEHVWLLSAAELAAIEPARVAVRTIVVAVAKALADAGVLLEQSWPGDLAVIAELLLLEAAGYQVPWDATPRELAEMLQPPANAAIEIDGSGSRQRRWASQRAEGNTTALRRAYEEHLHGPRRRAPYAGGGRRAVPRPTEDRRAVLRKVLEVFPETTAAGIVRTYQHPSFKSRGPDKDKPATPGGYLRSLLKDAACPSKSTLAADLQIIRADDSGAEE